MDLKMEESTDKENITLQKNIPRLETHNLSLEIKSNKSTIKQTHNMLKIAMGDP